MAYTVFHADVVALKLVGFRLVKYQENGSFSGLMYVLRVSSWTPSVVMAISVILIQCERESFPVHMDSFKRISSAATYQSVKWTERLSLKAGIDWWFVALMSEAEAFSAEDAFLRK